MLIDSGKVPIDHLVMRDKLRGHSPMRIAFIRARFPILRLLVLKCQRRGGGCVAEPADFPRGVRVRG